MLESDNRPKNQRTHSQYWFEDGNVVLQAEETLFRVHRSILSRHSQVFKDMFAIPHSPSQEDEYIEGCPVIPVSDTAQDMSNIIFLLYDPQRNLLGGKVTPTILGSMLRLGRKYEITDLENSALQCLKHDFPSNHSEWDSLERDDDFRIRIPHHDAMINIITIAHEFYLFTILPAAYSQYLQIWDICDIANSTGLSMIANQSCATGCARIMKYVKDKNVDALCPPLVLPSKKCSSGGKCEANRWNAIMCLPIWEIENEESDGFGILRRSSQSMGPEVEKLCPQCRSAVKTLTTEVREEFWSILPTFFDLPAWEDLKDGPP